MGTVLVKLLWDEELHIGSREMTLIKVFRLFVMLALSRDRVRGEKEGEGSDSGCGENRNRLQSRDQPLILLQHQCTHNPIVQSYSTILKYNPILKD